VRKCLVILPAISKGLHKKQSSGSRPLAVFLAETAAATPLPIAPTTASDLTQAYTSGFHGSGGVSLAPAVTRVLPAQSCGEL